MTFVPGGPYPENAENRRRIRYATLSGLRVARIVPVDAEHIGYFETSPEGQQGGLPSLIVYENLEIAKSQKRGSLDKVLLLWIDERVFGNATVRKTALLLREMSICNPTGGRMTPARLVMLGPALSGSVRSLLEEVGRVSQSDVDCVSPTLVLSTATVPDEAIIPGLDRYGRALPGSVAERMGASSGNAGIAHPRFLVKAWLARAGLDFVRVLPTDNHLIEQLNRELTARKATLDPARTRVAIVSEWDTLYGRRAVELVRKFMCPPPASCQGRVQVFEYPRGLDGVIPSREVKKTADRGDKAASQGLFQKDADPGARAEGASQVDYLRRLAARLDDLVSNEPEGTNESETSWAKDQPLVIGVVGSDVYDKLLILQALKPQHPQAIFFTFDLDARMLHGDEFNWARNLVVVAPLGLRLRPELQRSIPPFRDTYQTAYFLSARMAADRAQKGNSPEMEPIVDANWTPRVFEIGRGKEFDLSVDGARGECASALNCLDVTPAPPSFRPVLSKLDLWWVAAAGLVAAILLVFSSGVREALARSLSSWWGCLAWAAGLAFVAAISLLLAFGALWFDEPRPEPFSWIGGVSMWPTEIMRVGIFLLALVFSFVAARAVREAAKAMAVQYSLEVGDSPGHPATASGTANGGGPTNGHPVWAPPFAEVARGGRWRALCAAISRGWRELCDAIALREFDRIARREPADALRLWAEYRRQSQGWRRNVRIVLSMGLAFGMVMCFVLYFGFPRLPARGAIIRQVDWILAFFFCAPVVLWLQMYAVDVIRLCDKVASALAADRPTAWPAGARERFWSSPAVRGAAADGAAASAAPLAVSGSLTAVAEVATVPRAAASTAKATDDDASYWLDIQFTADWTARVSWLVYLPFVVICLMMVARSRFFDDWDTPPGLYTGFGLSLAYLVGCVGVLMRRANLLRGNAVRHLRARLRRLTGSGGSGAELDRVKVMIEDVERAVDGAFAPFSRQPIFGALAVMFGGAGITAVLQYLMGVR